MVATTLALFDGDADEATVVARIVALVRTPPGRLLCIPGASAARSP